MEHKRLQTNPFAILLGYKKRVATASVLVLLSNLLIIANPLIFRQALYALTPPYTESSYWSTFFQNLMGRSFHSVYVWALILLAFTLLSAYFKYRMRLIFLSISREVEFEVRDRLFSRIQMQSRSFFDRHQIGDIVSRLTNDITAYRDVLGPGIMYPAFMLTLVFPAFIALFALSVPLATLSLFPIISIYCIHLFTRKDLFDLSLKLQKQLSILSSMAHEHFSGIRIIKSYGIENNTFWLFERLCRAFKVMSFKLSCFQGMILPLITMMTRLTTIGLVLLAGSMIFLWDRALSLPDFLSFMWIQSYIFGPLLMLGWVLPMYQKGIAAYSRLIEMDRESIEVFDQIGVVEHIPDNADITFNHLTFSYPDQRQPALADLNFRLKGGSFIGITGPVGSGKTTLFRLLNRDYEVPRGSILIGDRDIHDYSLNAFRQSIVTVEQLPFLFSQTIAENVRFGNRGASQEEIELVAKRAALHDSIMEFSERYETIVGERGVSLSGGQKQRVAIARAFLVNRSILLLDDIFSALDLETEKLIFDSMKEIFKGKTLLLITHRVSILSQLDRVIYLLNGEVIEDGYPKDLMQNNGPYSALAGLQVYE